MCLLSADALEPLVHALPSDLEDLFDDQNAITSNTRASMTVLLPLLHKRMLFATFALASRR